MGSMKRAAIETIQRLPDDCSVEDIIYGIDLKAQVLDGLKDAEEGKLLTAEGLLERVGKWAV